MPPRDQRIAAAVKSLAVIVADDREEREQRKNLRTVLRSVTSRTPRWISRDASNLDGKAGCVDDHVVPLRILAGRLLSGADPFEMLSVADVTCRVTRVEDLRIDQVRNRWPDLEHQLCSSDLGPLELVALGWERYRRGGISVEWIGHRSNGKALLQPEPWPDGRPGFRRSD